MGQGVCAMSREPEGHPRFTDAVRGDLAEMARAKGARYPSLGGLVDILTLPGTWAVIFFRIGSACHHGGLRPISRLMYFLNIVVFGAEMHPGAIVAPGLVVPHPVGMGFAGGTRIGRRVRILRNAAIGGSGNPGSPGHPTIGDDVWILDSARVFGPVTIGDRTIVGTDAIVVDDVPADMFVHGPRKSTTFKPLVAMGLADHATRDDGLPIDLRTPAPVGEQR